jgi:hypothetical protein
MPQSSRHSQCSLLNTSALSEGLPVLLCTIQLCTKTCLIHYSLATSTHAQPFLEARHGFLVTDDDSPDEEFEKEDDLLAEADGLFPEDGILFEEGDGLLAEDNNLFDDGDTSFTSDNCLFAEEEGNVAGNAGFLDNEGVVDIKA